MAKEGYWKMWGTTLQDVVITNQVFHRQSRCWRDHCKGLSLSQTKCRSSVNGPMDTDAWFSFEPRKNLAHNSSCDCTDCRRYENKPGKMDSNQQAEKDWGTFQPLTSLFQHFRLRPHILSCSASSESWTYNPEDLKSCMYQALQYFQ